MEFGYGILSAQNPPGSGKTNAGVYQEIVDLVQVAEESDFDAAWTAEHHFMPDGHSPSPLTLCAGLATATETIDIGTCVLLAPFRHPIKLAEDAATVDLLSDGRFNLGIGAGYMEREFDVFDVSMKERAKHVAETIHICREAWTEGPVSHDGDLYQYSDLEVEPKPASENGPPIYLGGTSQQAVDRAAFRGDGFIGNANMGWEPSDAGAGEDGFDHWGDQSNYIAAEHDVDMDDFLVGILNYCYVAETDEEAWETMLPSFLYTRRAYAEHSKDRDPDEFTLENLGEERIERLKENLLVGSPETIVERLREAERGAACDIHMLLRMWQPKLNFEENARSIRLFGEEVIPELS
ncbi:LLM class flavin-dependent oxidoreductase [Halosolutus amylolyticus]|uniref:LLM class flavin-dependent oxidoreductase n=1 Tax=Halosolutus amylolyticus TaxID=2932267 RepID=A0ABD5PIF6_9EURY|nr:LLM class flavin-dependent oxidoreductase [Halosolutus amylolyticus]